MSVEGLAYVRAYYSGVAQVRKDTKLRYEVPPDRVPNYGEAGALILDPNDAGKRKKSSRLTLFCPFTLTANQITPDAAEISTMVRERRRRVIEGSDDVIMDIVETVTRVPEQELDDDRVERLSRIITDNWNMRCRLGLQSDLDVAAIVLTRMGKPVPEARLVVRTDESGNVKRSGKQPGERLLKSVNPESKPGKVLAFYMGDQRRSIMEGMAEFGATRSALQSNLFGLWRDNGIGYVLAADMVEIILPKDCEDPFAEPKAEGADKQEERVAPKNKGKPMQDPLLIKPLPEKGKRREVALACLNTWAKVEDIATKLGCSAGSVRSHLNDLHLKHGLGFATTADGKCSVIAPEGYIEDAMFEVEDPLA